MKDPMGFFANAQNDNAIDSLKSEEKYNSKIYSFNH